MNVDEYAKNLEIFAQDKFIGKFITTKSQKNLIEIAQKLSKLAKQKRSKNQKVTWEINIPRGDPIRFKNCKDNNLTFEPDLSCIIKGCDSDITDHNVLLRVWSLDDNICFRKDIDDGVIKNKIIKNGNKRVMLRFHIDKKDLKTTCLEPLFHMHVGGLQDNNELCWIHEKIKIPRFPFCPMDLILLCELILVNFFPKESESLRKKPEWTSLVRKSQDMFIKSFFEDCSGYINNKEDTLLGRMI